MELKVLTSENCEQIRLWRNEVFKYGIWRTSFLLTKEQQENFYEKDVCNRDSKNRWWGVHDEVDYNWYDGISTLKSKEDRFIGMVGLCNISLENRNAELTIIINPDLKQKGYGTKALKLLLTNGFNELNLENIYSETYLCNPNVGFWKNILNKYDIYNTILPWKKYYNGNYYNAIYFNFNKKDMEKLCQ